MNEKEIKDNKEEIKDKITKKSLFNPSGDDTLQERKIVNGNGTNLFSLLQGVKFEWARKMYFILMNNFWIPEKIDLTSDVNSYETLTTDEKKIFKDIISSLVFLDSLQTNNLPNIYSDITAPEIYTLIVVQNFQEVIHSESYNYIINNLIPASEYETFFDNWKRNETLFKRNQFLIAHFEKYLEEKNLQNFFKVLIADFILEGISFYVGFYILYTFAFRRKHLLHTVDIIRLIHRDELTHVEIFANLINSFRQEYGEIISEEEVKTIFLEASENEKNWCRSILEEIKIESLFTIEEAEDFVDYLVEICLSKINFSCIKENVRNPFEILEHMSGLSHNKDFSVRTNFFESTPTSYNMSSTIDWTGWDEE